MGEEHGAGAGRLPSGEEVERWLNLDAVAESLDPALANVWHELDTCADADAQRELVNADAMTWANWKLAQAIARNLSTFYRDQLSKLPEPENPSPESRSLFEQFDRLRIKWGFRLLMCETVLAQH